MEALNRGEGGLSNFSQVMVSYDCFFFVTCVMVSIPQKSQKDPVSLEERCDIIPLDSLGLLKKIRWTLGND